MPMKNIVGEHDDTQELPKEEQISGEDLKEAYDDLADFLGSDAFPMHALPRNAQIIIEDISANKCVQEEMIFMHLLALASACTGNALTVCPHKEIHATWHEPCTIWGMIVADSGESKSPTMKLIFKYLESRQFEAEKKYNEQYIAYEKAIEEWKSREDHDIGDVPPEEPSKTQYYVDDTTIEALHAILMTNKNGVLWRKDEIRGLLKNLNKYNKGESLDILLSLYSGFPWTVNRSSKKGRGSQASDTVMNAQVSIYGGIQPAVLENFFSKDDIFSGLVQRFLFCFLDKQTIKTLRTLPIPQSTLWLIEQMTDDMLYSSSMIREIYLTDDAFNLYNSFYVIVANHKPRSFLMKSTNNCLRIALALYQLSVSTGGYGRIELGKTIDAELMQNAITITKWFLVTLFKNIMPLLDVKQSKSEAITEKNVGRTVFFGKWLMSDRESIYKPMTCKEILQKMPRNHPFKNSAGKPSAEILGKFLAQAGYKCQKDGNGQRVYIFHDFENEEE